ncbi:unnamed protein product, partial [Mesorhabditis belari]|uniref:Uncharacterized protein n=1 Tax=Mesorhabditis belari TaxID=2138241 RepID=A0AAF3F377_9BILA
MATSLDHLFGVTALMGNRTTSTEASTSTQDSLLELLENEISNSTTTIDPTNAQNETMYWLPSDLQHLYTKFTHVSHYEWIIFGILFIAVLLILALVTGICCWLFKHKKRVIERHDEPIVSEYEDGYKWPRCFACCCRKKMSRSQWERQGSASNLDPYKRQPLPPITGHQYDEDGYNGSYLPPNRLPPVEKKILHFHPNDATWGMNIAGIKDIPSVKISSNQHRPLPQLEKF